jgi:hypothetical protein
MLLLPPVRCLMLMTMWQALRLLLPSEVMTTGAPTMTCLLLAGEAGQAGHSGR